MIEGADVPGVGEVETVGAYDPRFGAARVILSERRRGEAGDDESRFYTGEHHVGLQHPL